MLGWDSASDDAKFNSIWFFGCSYQYNYILEIKLKGLCFYGNGRGNNEKKT